MESTPNHLKTNLNARYFPLKGYICAQLSVKLTGAEYQARTGIVPGQELQLNSNKKGRAMILMLDKSGSMAGKPFDALKKGAQIISESVFKTKEFQYFQSVFYDITAKELECQGEANLPDYINRLKALKAGESTNFVNCFKYIEKYVKTKVGLGDLSVIFFTDG